MIERMDVERLVGASVVSSDGVQVGQVTRIYPPDVVAPEYVLIEHRQADVGRVAAPLREAGFDDGVLYVGFTADELAGAPFIDTGAELDAADIAALASYYDDVRRGRDGSLTDESVPLPPRGQEKEIPSEGPGDAPWSAP